jgi:glycerol uptake facilitator-like aquaporin
MVNARFGGQAVPYSARVVAPALMVMAVILFMGAVSGAHLNPAVSIAFALRRDFPWKRVPMYIIAQFAGAVLATLGSLYICDAMAWRDSSACRRQPGRPATLGSGRAVAQLG